MLRWGCLGLGLLSLTLRGQLIDWQGKDSTIFISGQVFLPNYPISTCSNPWGTAVADFTGDQWEDIVVGCRAEGKIQLYINGGSAEFRKVLAFPSLKDTWKPLAIDLNEDGHLDVVVASYMEAKIGWHLGNGRGQLPLSGSIGTGKGPNHLFTGDWDNDGKIDLGVVCYEENSVHLFQVQPSGSLKPYKVLSAPNRPRVAIAADLDRDKKVDIVVGGEEPFLLIFYGKAGYTAAPQRLDAPPSIWAMDAGDLNKDARPDLVVATYSGSSLATFFNAGYGRWEEPRVQPSGHYNFSLYLGDFDKDGDLDAVTVSARDNVINVHLNDGKGNLSDRHLIATGKWPIALTLADVNGDDNVDFITTSLQDNAINVHRNIPVRPPKPVIITISGRLIDGDTGEEIAGNVLLIDSTVMMRAGREAEALQVQRFQPGRPFRFEVVGGRHSLTLQGGAPGYPSVEEHIKLPALRDIPDSILKNGIRRDLVLRRIQRIKVWGYITDAAKQQPISQAFVRLSTQAGEVLAEITANQQGYYEAFVPLGAHHRLQAEANGYEPAWQIFSAGREHHPRGLRIDLALQPAVPRQSCIEGVVRNQASQAPVPNAVLVFIDQAGVRRRLSAKSNGTFKDCLPPGNYYVEIIQRGFFPLRDSVTIPQGGLKRDFFLNPVEAEKAIVLRNIYFDFDKATLRPESIEELERVVRFLQENPSLRVEISGHTDSDGSDIYNLRLSQARAQAVVDYLVGRGIEATRLVARGYGESRPVAPNDTPENKQKNRRTELKILGL
ncbi:MAG: FG-GAP-like repeat-containing protein [Bacteroidia bacterium]